MNARIAEQAMTALGRPGAAARATRIGGGRASEVFRVQGGERDVIAYWLPEGGVREAQRRFAVLDRLAGQFRLAPKPLAVGDAGAAALLLVERLGGVAPATCGPLAPDTVRRLAEQFVATLAALHALEIAPADRPPDYLRRILGEWRRRWNAEAAGAAVDADFRAVANWLAERIPDAAPAAFLHNDYKLDNILVDPGDPARVVGVVDWELAAVGHPLADLGAALAYWIEPGDSSLLRLDAPGPSCAPGAPTRAALVELYAAAAGRDVAEPAYWYAYGLLRLAVITQQLALRRRDEGQRVPRSALIVRWLLDRAAQACGSGRL
ncbi:phosphotransferase family protein (plasmid) [Burkholderia sp. FERM BP-3421]|uniref:phosphotransferase family protein n=1 Tax=Burkholderia sp. FERM BP-3421 TaxID=1494466 RepID=UPI0023617B9F|nr:phosphotransferase family protein [Burkholderia sp. FERM BP-3421]WDD90772.1 phosphotransferase family protein [Burkholderia sp. FERM BP-3421]